MDSWRNLVVILLCLVCGSSCGDVVWPLLNMDLLDEDIRKEVDQALWVVNQPSFQGWRLELIQQGAPRMHIGLVELWLQFRKLQKDKDEMWRKMKRMIRISTASCQELKDKIRDFTIQVPDREDVIENRVEIMSVRVKAMEDGHESANRTHKMKNRLEEGKNSSERRACSREPRANSATGSRKGKVSKAQLAYKVAALTELLNGHNELLVELYQRMTAPEEMKEAKRTLVTTQVGSGDGR